MCFLTIRKAITVQLQTLTLGAVTRFPRSHALRLQIWGTSGLLLGQTFNKLGLHICLALLFLFSCQESIITELFSLCK